MSQISPQDARQAIALLKETDGSVRGPLIAPEQMDAILAIGKETDPTAKAAKTCAMIDQLLKESEEGSRQLRQLFEQIGLEPGQVEGFVASDRLGGEAKRDLSDALQEFQQEVMQDVNAEAQRVDPRAARSSAPRTGHMRV